MTAEAIKIDETGVRKLLGAASPDAALLYIFIAGGNAPEDAEAALHIPASRLSIAMATLRQLGLLPEKRPNLIQSGSRPSYCEEDVLHAMQEDMSFRGLYQELQRLLGRPLNTDELKIILGFTRYLGLTADVILLLVRFCCDRARRRGSGRRPSLLSIEKEAYFWAENGIDSLEEASAYIQNQNFRSSRLHGIMDILQIRGRFLTQAEERYAQSWLDMGFEDGAIAMAYDRTCLNTGGLNWSYMNKILQRWHKAGLHTVQEIGTSDAKKGADTQRRPLDEDETAAIRNMFPGV